MPDFYAPYRSDSSGGGLQTLKDLMSLQQQKQSLQSGQLDIEGKQSQNQSLAAKAQGDTRAIDEQQRVAQMLSSGKDDQGNDIRGADGNPDPVKVLPALGRMAPITGQTYAQHIIQTQTDKAKLEGASQSLDAQGRAMLMGPVQAAVTDPTKKAADVDAGIDNLVQAHPEMANAATYLKTLTQHLDSAKTPQQRTQIANSIAASIQGGQQVDTQPKAGVQDLGGKLQPIVQQPGAAGGAVNNAPGAATIGIPPGFELTEDPVTHNKYLWNRQTGQTRAFGTGAPGGPAPGGGSAPSAMPQSPGAPPSAPKSPAVVNAPPQREIGDAESQAAQVETNFKNHQANVSAASSANQQRDQIHQAAQLLDSGVKTGKGAQTLGDAESLLSKVPGLEDLAGNESQAAKHDLLNKFLERIGADYGSLNGSPAKTDAGADSLRKQIGSTDYNPAALRDVLKYTDAQYAAAQAKDKAEQQYFANGGKITNQHEFEKQWRNSYDPRVYQLANEDKNTAKDAISKMTPADRATFLKKYAELKAMGAAPQ